MTESHAVVLGARKEGVVSDASSAHRWLFIDGASTFGGHEVMLLRWLEELASERATTQFVLARAGSELAREASRHATVLDLPPQRTGARRSLLDSIRDAAALVRAIMSVRPHLCIVAEGCLLAQPLFVTLARLLGSRVVVYVPLVQTSASMGFGHSRSRDWLIRTAYSRLPHAWITLTREQAQDFRAWAHVRRPILVLPNTVASAIENRGARCPEPAAHGHRLRVVVLGRIEAHQKGLDTLMDHLAAHPELGSRMCVTLVGSGPYEGQIRARLSADPALAKWVALRPWSPPVEALDAHDVLLMTSRYEGVPLVMLEAMALGVPVVAPDLAGTRAFMARSELFPREDMTAAFRILEQLQNSGARRAIAERNRAAFEATAANAAFGAAVKSLTHELQRLGVRSLRRRGA